MLISESILIFFNCELVRSLKFLSKNQITVNWLNYCLLTK